MKTISPERPIPTRILGIDPGLQCTGYAVLEGTLRGVTLCEAGVVRTTGKDLAVRLTTLFDSMAEVLEEWKPESIAIEQLYAHYAHPRTAILMGHARGVFFLLGGQRGLPVLSYPSTHIKRLVTGSGHASKLQMQHAVMRELGLTKPPEPHDVADAIAVALCHLSAKKRPDLK
ncbi:crossover junction endodeoxyribonuclease RuvC [soil metagenome]